MLLANTCKAAIDSLGDFLGDKDMACCIVFAKTRHWMLDRNGQLNQHIVSELNPVFGGIINRMDCDYVDAMKKATEEGITIDGDWTPPEWRAPRWAAADGELNGNNIDHNLTMDNLIDDILKHWKAKTGEVLPMSRVKVYLAALASNYEKTESFDGDK